MMKYEEDRILQIQAKTEYILNINVQCLIIHQGKKNPDIQNKAAEF